MWFQTIFFLRRVYRYVIVSFLLNYNMTSLKNEFCNILNKYYLWRFLFILKNNSLSCIDYNIMLIRFKTFLYYTNLHKSLNWFIDGNLYWTFVSTFWKKTIKLKTRPFLKRLLSVYCANVEKMTLKTLLKCNLIVVIHIK